MSQKRPLEQGMVLFHQKEYQRAEPYFRTALARHTENQLEIKFRLAFCLEMQGKFEESESLYLQVGTTDGPPSIVGDALYRIGWMAMTLKDHTKAISYYKKAIEILKKNPNAQNIFKDCIYWMALSYEVIGQVIKALSIYEQIETDDVWFWDVSFRKIKCFDKIGRYEDALACCRKYIDRYRSANNIKRSKELYPYIDRMKEQLEKLLSNK